MADSFKRRATAPARAVSGAVALLLLAGAAAGQSLHVAVVTAASSNATTNANQQADIQSKLMGTGLFASVAAIDAGASFGATPTLTQLQAYSAVLVFSNNGFLDATALGNVMADYVDAGGGVVTTCFVNNSMTLSRQLAGRWNVSGGDYECIRAGSGNNIAVDTLGTVLVPGHPIMAGVNSISAGLRPLGTTLSPHGQVIAQWANGRILVATSTQFPRRVDLGMLAISTDQSSAGWSTATDGALLMANALVYASQPSTPPCYANCDASTASPVLNVGDFTCFLEKYATGDAYANCDESTAAPTLNVGDFTCFLEKYAAGCP